jgi:hypothetical protein
LVVAIQKFHREKFRELARAYAEEKSPGRGVIWMNGEAIGRAARRRTRSKGMSQKKQSRKDYHRVGSTQIETETDREKTERRQREDREKTERRQTQERERERQTDRQRHHERDHARYKEKERWGERERRAE